MESTSPISTSSIRKSRNSLIFCVVIVLIIAGAAYWHLFLRKAATPESEAPQGLETPEQVDLGSTLYEQAQNPIENKLPSTVSPVPNPVEGIYKNPFE